jgi:hypothetical protein
MAHTIYHQPESDNPVDQYFMNYNFPGTDLSGFVGIMNNYVNTGVIEESDLQSWAASYNEYQGTDFNVYNPDEWVWESSAESVGGQEYSGGYGDAPGVLYENSAVYDPIWAPDISNWTEEEVSQFDLEWSPNNENQESEWIAGGMDASTYTQMAEYADYLTIANYGMEEFQESQTEDYTGPLEQYEGSEAKCLRTLGTKLCPFEEEEYDPRDYHGASTTDRYYLEDWASPTGEKMYLSNRQVWEIQNETFMLEGQSYSGGSLLTAEHGPIGYDTMSHLFGTYPEELSGAERLETYWDEKIEEMQDVDWPSYWDESLTGFDTYLEELMEEYF